MSMLLLKRALIATLLTAQLAPAGELEDTIDALAKSHRKLEGYQATYEAKTSSGRSGTLKIGVDFKSSWSYLTSELNDEDGNPMQQGQQWSTGDGNFLMQSGDQKVLFEGFDQLAKRFTQLVKITGRDKGQILPRIKPNTYLDRTGVHMGIGYTTGGDNLLSKAKKVISKTDKEVVLDLEEYGEVTFETATGVITSQVIKTKNQTRTLKRVSWKQNPGKDVIANQFKVDLDDAKRQSLATSGMSQKFTRQVLQSLIDETARDQRYADKFKNHLTSIEDRFVDYLSHEPLDQAGFINRQLLFGFLDQAMAKTTERLKRDGKKIGVVEILTTPESRNAFIAQLVALFRQKAPANKKQEYLNEVLNGDLEGEKGQALVARVLVEDFIEHAYYRVRIGRAIDAYVEKLKAE